ncbi:hypothetical protein [Rhodococcus zopfii]|uniref:hypothetical protein n=1 Tax=Rhodococcus zopfii TaxID=43772 RepID=UPI00197F09F7|nr:hypothetical protein [Rhodococcus zopfii]
MDLFDVARSCFRRWYVLLPLLLITAFYSYNVYSSAKPVYYANAVIGLAPPSVRQDVPTTAGEVRRNGLLDVGGASLLANLTALGLREPSVVDRVVAAGGQSDYVAKAFPTPSPNPQLPLVFLEQTAADPASVTTTLDLVSAQAEVTLRTIQQQARVPDDQMVAPFVVQPPSEPIAALPSRTRATVGIFAAGFGLSVLCTVLLDVMLTRRKARTAAGPRPADHAEPVVYRQPSSDGNEQRPVDEPLIEDSR